MKLSLPDFLAKHGHSDAEQRIFVYADDLEAALATEPPWEAIAHNYATELAALAQQAQPEMPTIADVWELKGYGADGQMTTFVKRDDVLALFASKKAWDAARG